MMLDNKYLLCVTAGIFSFAFVPDVCYIVPIEDHNFHREWVGPYQENKQKQLMLQTLPLCNRKCQSFQYTSVMDLSSH